MNFTPASFATLLDDYLTRITPFGFSGGALLAHKDRILLEKGYGLADRENRISNRADTLFNMGSITKPFTAAAVMKLAQMGRLDVQDRIGLVLEGVPEDKQAITIHNLLTHTAGLIMYTGDDYAPASKEQFLDKVFSAPLVFRPGSAYDYSNAGYSLLGAIVERVSGQPFEDFLYEQLLKPAGMEQTGYTRPDWSGKSIARWYAGSRDNGHALEKPYPYWNLIGNGEMFSTLRDMFRWHQALVSDDLLDGGTKARMYTPYLETYAYGWRIEETGIGRLVHHNGATDLGNSALLRRYLDAELVLVMFCNQSYGDVPMVVPLKEKIDQLIAGEVIELPPGTVQIADPEKFRPYEGVYVLPGGARISASGSGQTLMLAAEGQEAINMLAFPGSSSETHQPLNQYHQEVFQAFFEEDDGPFRDFLTRSGRPWKDVKRGLRSTLNEARNFFGEFVGLEVAGTVPSSFVNGALDTFVTLQYERGRVAILSITQDGMNIGLTLLEFAQGWSLPSVPYGEGLLGYQIPLGLVVELSVETNYRGAASALRTKNGERAVLQPATIQEIL